MTTHVDDATIRLLLEVEAATARAVADRLGGDDRWLAQVAFTAYMMAVEAVPRQNDWQATADFLGEQIVAGSRGIEDTAAALVAAQVSTAAAAAALRTMLPRSGELAAAAVTDHVDRALALVAA